MSGVLDDYKYSIGRIVLYKHPNPEYGHREYGRYGPEKTLGVVHAVEIDEPAQVWMYSLENIRTHEPARVPESDIYYAVFGRQLKQGGRRNTDAARLAEDITKVLSQPEPRLPLSPTITELVRREQTEDETKRMGRDLPVQVGDYVRVRGDLRAELEPHHNHYAKVLEVLEPEIGAIEAKSGTYAVRQKFQVRLDDGVEVEVYDPEIKVYYTADGRSTIFNWRAASFLAEFFGDDPPYKGDYAYLENHLFTRDELESMSIDELAGLFAELIYVKGRMGLRDLEQTRESLKSAPREHVVDSILAISRFDMRKNRNLTAGEIEIRQKDASKLRHILRDR